jgi:hypothetical protein
VSARALKSPESGFFLARATLLGLEPEGDHLIIAPALPESVGQLQLLDIPGRWGHMDAFGRARTQ